MDLTGLLNSYLGMYMVQSVYHSLVAALVTDAALKAWRVESPLMRQRFRLAVLVVSLCLFPLYQAVNPDRGSLSFRLEALFDSSRWMNLDLIGGVTGGAVFVTILLFTTLVFLFQEVFPIFRHTIGAREVHAAGERPAADSEVVKALANLPGNKPEVLLIDDEEYLFFSTTGKQNAVYLSTGFVKDLTEEELRAAIAHEIGHIQRSRRPLLVATFLIRMVLFFNPVALMEFRRIVHEEEKICDDAAVALTGNPFVLAEVLRKFSTPRTDLTPDAAGDSANLRDRLEEYSHSLLIENRIARLEEAAHDRRAAGVWPVFVFTVLVIVVINYSVV